MLATVETLSQDIARIERADKIAAEIAASQPVDGGVQAPTEADQKAAAAKYRSAWKQAIERGVRGQCRRACIAERRRFAGKPDHVGRRSGSDAGR